MSDEELLKEAEATLNNPAGDMLSSIAASLLVIARNSVEKVEGMQQIDFVPVADVKIDRKLSE